MYHILLGENQALDFFDVTANNYIKILTEFAQYSAGALHFNFTTALGVYVKRLEITMTIIQINL